MVLVGNDGTTSARVDADGIRVDEELARGLVGEAAVEEASAPDDADTDLDGAEPQDGDQ